MSSRKNLDVRRVRSSLVATFGKANPPLVWRFDLERNHSFTMAIRAHNEEWELGMNAQKNEFLTVARFAHKDDAEDALARVGDVLADDPSNMVFSMLRNLGIALLLFFMALWGWSYFSHHPSASPPAPVARAELPPAPQPPPAMTPPTPTGSASEQVPLTTPNGIPLPADDVLKPPPN